MTAKTLMVLGSMSSAGKSLLVTGLCRLYARRGWKTAPFKAQNMSNNAAVCSGGEIGRAQAAQAYAAGVEPTVDMNPVLLKPEADSRSQVIVRGQVQDSLSARDYYARRGLLWQAVTESIDHLKDRFDLLIMEGAGSPAEINLRRNDIVNLAAARYAQAPCLLVGDIDRGGVFAQLLGTLWLLDDNDRRFVRGLIVNKFRGDINLFTDGIRILQERSSLPVLGVVPFLHGHGIADEDAAPLGDYPPAGAASAAADIAVIHFPHISNSDDMDPLKAEPQVRLRYVRQAEQLGQPSAVILPGTKNTLDDLRWLHESGLSAAIRALAAAGAPVTGLCGGYQMLGDEVSDRQHRESALPSLPGLGLLPGATAFTPVKTVTRTAARILADNGFLAGLQGQTVQGYEIHMGQTSARRPFSQIISREAQPVQALDGACSADGKIWGTYLHGIWDNDNLRIAWLGALGVTPSALPFSARRNQAYDRLADALEAVLDMAALDRIITEGV
jgi:adenosylcobyric acid synthase